MSQVKTNEDLDGDHPQALVKAVEVCPSVQQFRLQRGFFFFCTTPKMHLLRLSTNQRIESENGHNPVPSRILLSLPTLSLTDILFVQASSVDTYNGLSIDAVWMRLFVSASASEQPAHESKVRSTFSSGLSSLYVRSFSVEGLTG